MNRIPLIRQSDSVKREKCPPIETEERPVTVPERFGRAGHKCNVQRATVTVPESVDALQTVSISFRWPLNEIVAPLVVFGFSCFPRNGQCRLKICIIKRWIPAGLSIFNCDASRRQSRPKPRFGYWIQSNGGRSPGENDVDWPYCRRPSNGYRCNRAQSFEARPQKVIERPER